MAKSNVVFRYSCVNDSNVYIITFNFSDIGFFKFLYLAALGPQTNSLIFMFRISVYGNDRIYVTF